MKFGFRGLIVLAVLITPVCPAFQQEQSNHHDVSQSAVSLEGLLRFLETYHGDEDAEAIAVRLIQRHGLSFRPTVEDLARLKKASASSELLSAIELAKKPPAPKVARKEGKLEVACQPVDCIVWIDSKEIGITQHGLLPAISALEGRVTVAVMRTDYEPELARQEAVIRQNQVTRVQFNLKPSRAALVARGTNLFQQMLESLGTASKSVTRPLRASGTISIQAAKDQSADWSIVVSIDPDNIARFDLSREKERYQLTRTEKDYIWKKKPKSKEVLAVEDAIRLLINEQLPHNMRRLQSPHLTMVAANLLTTNAANVVRAESISLAYTITLDSAGRPGEIRIESGLDSGTRIVYSDYTEQAGGAYPKTIEVVLPNGTIGVRAHFDNVEVGRSDDKHTGATHQ